MAAGEVSLADRLVQAGGAIESPPDLFLGGPVTPPLTPLRKVHIRVALLVHMFSFYTLFPRILATLE